MIFGLRGHVGCSFIPDGGIQSPYVGEVSSISVLFIASLRIIALLPIKNHAFCDVIVEALGKNIDWSA